ncbi:unnamed protein product [Acidithrix sp. C25]|nr:unnamed protein product [Acidithrix sp. C25]
MRRFDQFGVSKSKRGVDGFQFSNAGQSLLTYRAFVGGVE